MNKPIDSELLASLRQRFGVDRIIEQTRPEGKFHPLEILEKWLHGCSCVDPFPGGHPVTCRECTDAMVDALRKSILSLSNNLLESRAITIDDMSREVVRVVIRQALEKMTGDGKFKSGGEV